MILKIELLKFKNLNATTTEGFDQELGQFARANALVLRLSEQDLATSTHVGNHVDSHAEKSVLKGLQIEASSDDIADVFE